ncbi:alpha/beta fold hydrolase [Streptomyces pseudovenezuelae]|uniref:Pimeloyl-ACP methyl ester carboxylesterase n=1 Tax=Streptomyces pseudovenezuelae TaxID=67350 RepID=A0ABT6LXQ5_9ACTN|nr:alpha/beta hydrolase [Streptomyces pseudovenezuelae]MDH6221067.1 pimeloyl-ACP methyl ester carboxylesterase [Streptomyces pseudovenezuelae]
MTRTTARSATTTPSRRRPFRRTAVVGLSALALATITIAAHAVDTGSTATTTSTRATQATASDRPKPTVVLVHGAFADASGWDGVITRLTRDGYPVRALPDPLRGLASDSAYIHSFLKTIPGPVVLVGHSYGGAVITNAAVGEKQVKALVYVAAFAPDSGEDLADLSARPVAHPVPPLPVQPVPYTLPGGGSGLDLYLDPAKFRAAFAADVPARTAVRMAAGQRPIDATAIAGITPEAAWHTTPSWYLVAKQDHAISPDLERFMAARAHAHVTEINSSHAATVSHPAAVKDLIEQADRGTR